MNQHRGRRAAGAFAVVSVLFMPVLSAAQAPADNTKVNTRDRVKGAVTADQSSS